MTLAHWDEVEPLRRDLGDIHSTWRELGGPAGATAVGVTRVDIDPGARGMPLHLHGAEEEIFYVLEGSGLAILDDAAHEVAAGDTVVCLVASAGGPAHTFVAGPEGLSLLAFGENIDTKLVHFPRAQVLSSYPFLIDASGGRAWQADADAGPLEPPPPSPRPPSIVSLADVEVDVGDVGEFAWTERDTARAAGSVRTGVRHATLPPGRATCPPHWHSAEHELFAILEGDGTLLLYDRTGAVKEEHPVRAGHVVSRPAGTGIAHMFRAGDDGMTLLTYGMRHPNEITFYPRSRKAWVGQVMVRFETVDDYWDGEV